MPETIKSLNVVVVDDEERAADALRLMLERFVPQATRIVVCTDARQAAASITQNKPDIVFLDIKMPHLSGFDVLDQIEDHHFKIIFTTAFNEYAIKAIRFSAFDYLLKPVDVEELINAIDRFLTHERDVQLNKTLLQNIQHNMKDTIANFRLAIPSKDGVCFVNPADVLYCEGINNYTRFYTQDGRQLLASKTLGEYEDLLEPHHFIRCHKSYLVNKAFVSYIDHQGFIILKNSVRIEVSKRRRAEVLKMMKL